MTPSQEERKVYVIWNVKDDRPAIVANSYAPILVFLTEEQAEAYESEASRNESRGEYFIKEMTLK